MFITLPEIKPLKRGELHENYEALLSRARPWVKKSPERVNTFRVTRLFGIGIINVSRDLFADDTTFWLAHNNVVKVPVLASSMSWKELKSGKMRLEVRIRLPHELHSYLAGGTFLNKYALYHAASGMRLDLMVVQRSMSVLDLAARRRST